MPDNIFMKFRIICLLLISSLFITSMPMSPQAFSRETQVHDSSIKLDPWHNDRSRDRYLGHLLLHASTLVTIFQAKRCVKALPGMRLSCGITSLLAAAAGIALFAGEVYTIFKHQNLLKNLEYNKSQLDSIREECLDGDGADVALKKDFVNENCSQFSAIIAQRDAYVSMKEALDWQLLIRKVAAIAYTAAAGVELAYLALRNISDTTLISSGLAANGVCAATAAGPQAAACGSSVATCQPALAAFNAAITKKVASLNSPAPDSASQVQCEIIRGFNQAAKTTITNGCVGGCCAPAVAGILAKLNLDQKSLDCIVNPSACELGCQLPGLLQTKKEVETDFQWASVLFDSLISRAFSENESNEPVTSFNSSIEVISGVLSLGGLGISALVTILGTQNYEVNTLFSTPLKRSIWYGAVGALIGVSSLHTQQAIEEVNGYISDLNSLLFIGSQELKATPVTTNSVTNNGANADFESHADIDYGETDDLQKSICPNGGDGKGECIKLPKSVFSDLKELDLDQIAGTSNNVEELANELMKKDGSMKNGMKLAHDIAAKKSLVKKFFDQAKNQLLETQKKNGLTPLEYDKEVQKVAALLRSKAKESFNKISPVTNKLALDVSTKEINSEEAKPDNSKKVKKETPEPEESKGAEQTLSFNLSQSQNELITDGNFSDEEKERRDKILTSQSLISKNKSIFQAISIRYQKTGYGRLLEELK